MRWAARRAVATQSEQKSHAWWWRRLLGAAVTAVTVAAPLALSAQPSQADILPPVSDVGVSLQVAQATLNSVGQTVITWQNAATITPGKNTLLRAQFYNDGTIPQLSATLTVDAGGKLAAGFAIPGCTVSAGLTDDTVSCNYGTVMPGQAEPFVYIAVATGTAPSVTSIATQTATPDGLATVAPDGDETATATTTVLANSGFAFLTDGQSVSFTSTDGEVSETFALPAGATGGTGGVFVQLSEVSSAGTTCGGAACYAAEAKASFVQVGGSPVQASNPFTDAITYNNAKQTCNGLGGGSGCNPIYFLPTGVTAGAATQVPKCSTYGTNGAGTPNASSDPCVYDLTHTTSGVTTYGIALLSDPGFPIPHL